LAERELHQLVVVLDVAEPVALLQVVKEAQARRLLARETPRFVQRREMQDMRVPEEISAPVFHVLIG
jgi:hypothetical protein